MGVKMKQEITKSIEKAEQELREKQIEEMAQVLKDYTKKEKIMASHPILEDYAEVLYSEGYRKQVQGEWMKHYFSTGIIGYVCSNCNACVYEEDFHQDYFHKNYCGHCGAYMTRGETNE